MVIKAIIPNSRPLNLNLESAYPPVDAKTTPVLIKDDCPRGSKDNVAPIKGVRFSSKNYF